MTAKGQRWSTEGEAEYPALLCSRLAQALLDHLGPSGLAPSAPSGAAAVIDKCKHKDIVMKDSSHIAYKAETRKVTAGRQSRWSCFAQLVPEYRSVAVVRCRAPQEVASLGGVGSRLVAARVLGGLPLPRGARQLSVQHEVGLPGLEGYIVEVGIPWTAYEFSNKALDLIHPFEAVRSIQSPANLRSIFNILTLGPTAIKIKRMKLVADLGKRRLNYEGRRGS